MDTEYTIFRPDGTYQRLSVDWPNDPGYDRLNALLKPIVAVGDALWEHVSVLADGKHCDMFVDESGLLKGLPRNESATAIYRAASLRSNPKQKPESLPIIVGVAVLFHRRVWF